MERIRKSLAEGVELIVNRTEQFKTGLLSVTLTVPLKAETATANALIPDVLYQPEPSRYREPFRRHRPALRRVLWPCCAPAGRVPVRQFSVQLY